MPKRVPLQSITVHRKDGAMTPPLNEPFEFTADEIAQIEKMSPGALSPLATVDVSKSDVKVDASKVDAGKTASKTDAL